MLCYKLEIWQTNTKLSIEFTRVISQFQAGLRDTLGVQMINSCVELQLLIYKANKESTKVLTLESYLEELERLKILTRLAYEVRAISEGKLGEIVELFDSCGRQANAWRKSMLG